MPLQIVILQPFTRIFNALNDLVESLFKFTNGLGMLRNWGVFWSIGIDAKFGRLIILFWIVPLQLQLWHFPRPFEVLQLSFLFFLVFFFKVWAEWLYPPVCVLLTLALVKLFYTGKQGMLINIDQFFVVLWPLEDFPSSCFVDWLIFLRVAGFKHCSNRPVFWGVIHV